MCVCVGGGGRARVRVGGGGVTLCGKPMMHQHTHTNVSRVKGNWSQNIFLKVINNDDKTDYYQAWYI